MKKKHNPKFGPLGILIGIFIIGIIVYIVTNRNIQVVPMQNDAVNSEDFKNYTSEALKISFKYPKDWTINELGGRSVSIINLGKEEIKILITKTSMLQNQSFKDYIKIIDYRSKDTNKIEMEKNIVISNKSGIERIVKPFVGSDLRQYIIIFVENNGFMYSISATPADSELIPVFNKIVNSIEFK